MYAALNSHAHYLHAGEHYYAVVWHRGPIKATTYDLTGLGSLVMVGNYYLVSDDASASLGWLGFPYRWGQYIWNFDEVYFLSTNYFDQEEVNPGPADHLRSRRW